LLEVYYAAGNKSGYETAAQALKAAVVGRGALWDSAVAMWYEMSPERPLLAHDSGTGERESEDSDAQREVFDITSPGASWATERSSEPVGLEAASDLDFDLTDEREPGTPIGARETRPKNIPEMRPKNIPMCLTFLPQRMRQQRES
jgi:hypothetical protein